MKPLRVGDRVRVKTDDFYNGKVGTISKLDRATADLPYGVMFDDHTKPTFFDRRELVRLVKVSKVEKFRKELAAKLREAGSKIGPTIDGSRKTYYRIASDIEEGRLP